MVIINNERDKKKIIVKLTSNMGHKLEVGIVVEIREQYFHRHLLTNGDLSRRSYLHVFRVKTQQKQKEMK